ncbi:bifunctional diguanylate cyclase/phosphodiesterase [Vibrio gazogenes]|uniref:Diguanylate cyclase (GGDEF) domain-containing protein n=1 Tax=Vibrio gazogenes DSM 21264 = NBRC 103151 TaxID=1123492 RepID=A0A1M4XU41_VIBGA|nr:bifunctional diguanylate cyclase/phosphodiesterase [Vibrio gazogenes]USP12877.1 bifunctional diguanylate cyclase/phosphodiesterase [Vibrio gazogenes]SHE97114.1 diguanylate cyclase (GGDEF) domain-containing protein [Vibrio gazogenes DSM 21264] [Vibrio gazogenes DSM 21264 = NBRC 103151]SJN57913.1 Phytochrome-like protein cph2 [Vibrio gazogenes]
MKQKYMQTSLEKKIRARAKRDLFYICVIVLILSCLSLIAKVDLFEQLYFFSRQHEHWEMDEITVVVFWFGLGGVFYAYRRMQDLRDLIYEVSDKAFFDQVSQLPNRVYSLECLTQMLHRAERLGRQVAVIFIDLDNFKMVNDTYGHAKGDLLLQVFGERLRYSIRKSDIVGRLSGDEYLILLELADEDELAPILERIKSLQEESYRLDENNLVLRFSAGVAIYPYDGYTATDLLKASDIAMYHSKVTKKGQIEFYTSSMAEMLYARYQLESDLKTALQNKAFHMEYQPQLSLESDQIIGYEALIRWELKGKQIPTAQLIQIAEDTGHIEEIGLWVLSQALEDAQSFLQADQTLGVNITSRHFWMSDFVCQIQRALSVHEFPPHRLVLELTESALVSDIFDDIRQKLMALRALGVNVAIDDFGIGYSCLGRLKDLPISCLKIDQIFTHALVDSERDRYVISTLINMAKHLNLSILAEGVESKEQLAMLYQIGCNMAQGYYIGKPESLATLVDRMKSSSGL